MKSRRLQLAGAALMMAAACGQAVAGGGHHGHHGYYGGYGHSHGSSSDGWWIAGALALVAAGTYLAVSSQPSYAPAAQYSAGGITYTTPAVTRPAPTTARCTTRPATTRPRPTTTPVTRRPAMASQPTMMARWPATRWPRKAPASHAPPAASRPAGGLPARSHESERLRSGHALGLDHRRFGRLVPARPVGLPGRARLTPRGFSPARYPGTSSPRNRPSGPPWRWSHARCDASRESLRARPRRSSPRRPGPC